VQLLAPLIALSTRRLTVRPGTQNSRRDTAGCAAGWPAPASVSYKVHVKVVERDGTAWDALGVTGLSALGTSCSGCARVNVGEERAMPVIDLTLPGGCFERAGQEALAAELTRLIIHWAGGIGRSGYDTASWALVHDAELAEVGGRLRRPDRRQVYRVVVSVPFGSLDAARRSGLMHDVARAVIAAEGGEPTTENLMRVRCVVDEIPDGSWDVAPGRYGCAI
jgi:hypothetical protein